MRLRPGESTTFAFDITSALLSFYDADMNCVAEPSDFELMIDNFSRDSDLTNLILHVTL